MDVNSYETPTKPIDGQIYYDCQLKYYRSCLNRWS